MRILQTGVSGPDVKKWQHFLIGRGLRPGPADGVFGDDTYKATAAFQRERKIDVDGRVGNQTLATAMLLGFEAVSDPDDGPRKPYFPPLGSNAARQVIFGKFAFEPKPLPTNPENIVVAGEWRKANIVMVTIPELARVAGAPASGSIAFHRLAAAQMAALWVDWRKAKLANRVLSWGGSYVPRFIRGSTSVLSNHSFGSAFDINVPENPLGVEPARIGKAGCVRELVEIANAHGFYWGGHFTRRDGMHFEIAKLQ